MRGLLPELCTVCKLELQPTEQSICHVCVASLARCSQLDAVPLMKLAGTLPSRKHPSIFDACLAFAEPTKTLCYSFKYGQNSRLARQLGKRIMAPKIAASLAPRLASTQEVVLCPMPIHFKRRWSRGYNQSAQLARGCASGLRALGIPACTMNLLEKSLYRKSQVHLDGFARWSNAQGTFRAKKNRPPKEAILVLVDDTVATGATMLYAAEALLQAHPQMELHLVALAVDL